MEEKVRAHAIIRGRVQGVSYRWSTQQEAKRIGGISGWVKNRSDGTVEAVFEGMRTEVDAILRWCENGSPLALVEAVDVTWESYSGAFSDFEIAH